MRARSAAIGSAVLALFLLNARTIAQGPSSIDIDVGVADASGRPVRGLGAADFEITEDGTPMPVQACSVVDIAKAGVEARSYVLVVDGFHLSSRGAQRVQPLLEQFVAEGVVAGDRAAVAWLGSSPRISALTTDRQALLRAVGIASSSARGISSARGAAGEAPLEFGASLDSAGATYALLTLAVDRVLHDQHGEGRRAAVVFISEGMAIGGAEPRATVDAQRAFLAAAARHHASVYPIDPLGMSAINSGLATPDESEPFGLAQWDSLRELAASTGGRATLGRTDPGAAYRQIVQDNSSYYLLTYASPHASDRDGHFHEVRVRVKRAGLKVTARKGWFEPK